MRNETGARWTMAVAVLVLRTLAASECAAAERRIGAEANEARGPRRVVVSISDRKLAVVENDKVIGRFDVAVGRPASPSPVGTFTIVNRIERPTYYAPGKVIPPSTRNPLGTRWLGLSIKGFGIHGTDEPRSIGHARSHGCIRLRNSDIEVLFDLVRPGDIVELHLERTAEICELFAAANRAPVQIVAANLPPSQAAR